MLPTIYTFNHLLVACDRSKSEARAKIAEDLYKLIPQVPFRSGAGAGGPRAAVEVPPRGPSSGAGADVAPSIASPPVATNLRPSIYTYVTLVAVLSKAGEFARAAEIVAHDVNRELWNTLLFNALLRGMMTRKNATEAVLRKEQAEVAKAEEILLWVLRERDRELAAADCVETHHINVGAYSQQNQPVSHESGAAATSSSEERTTTSVLLEQGDINHLQGTPPTHAASSHQVVDPSPYLVPTTSASAAAHASALYHHPARTLIPLVEKIMQSHNIPPDAQTRNSLLVASVNGEHAWAHFAKIPDGEKRLDTYDALVIALARDDGNDKWEDIEKVFGMMKDKGLTPSVIAVTNYLASLPTWEQVEKNLRKWVLAVGDHGGEDQVGVAGTSCAARLQDRLRALEPPPSKRMDSSSASISPSITRQSQARVRGEPAVFTPILARCPEPEKLLQEMKIRYGVVPNAHCMNAALTALVLNSTAENALERAFELFVNLPARIRSGRVTTNLMLVCCFRQLVKDAALDFHPGLLEGDVGGGDEADNGRGRVVGSAGEGLMSEGPSSVGGDSVFSLSSDSSTSSETRVINGGTNSADAERRSKRAQALTQFALKRIFGPCEEKVFDTYDLTLGLLLMHLKLETNAASQAAFLTTCEVLLTNRNEDVVDKSSLSETLKTAIKIYAAGARAGFLPAVDPDVGCAQFLTGDDATRMTRKELLAVQDKTRKVAKHRTAQHYPAIDLHALNARLGPFAAWLFLREHSRQPVTTSHVYVVTGRGSHSPGGVSKIKNAVQELLVTMGFARRHKWVNAGRVRVSLGADDHDAEVIV